MFVMRVRAGAADAEPVERRDTQRTGEIAVAAAAELPAMHAHALALGDRLGKLPKTLRPCLRAEEWSHRTALDLQARIREGRLEPGHACDDVVEIILRRRDAEHFSMAFRRHHVDESAALYDADAETLAAIEIGPALDRLDQPCHRADRAGAAAVMRAGMGRLAIDVELEAQEGMPPGDDAAIHAGLGDEHMRMALRLGLDQRARRGAADLLVGDEQERDRQAEPSHPRALDLRQRIGREIHPAFHVEDARSEHLIAVAPDRQRAGQRPDEMDGVEMAEHQHTGLVRRAGDRRAHHVAIAVDPRDAPDDGAERAHRGDRLVHHAIHAAAIGGRTLDRDPAQDPREDLLGIEAVGGGAHRGLTHGAPLAPESPRPCAPRPSGLCARPRH